MKYCTHCGAELRRGLPHCTACSRPVPGGAPPPSRTPTDRRVAALISFCVLFATGAIWLDANSSSAKVLAMLAVTGLLVWTFGLELASGLEGLCRLPILAPWWAVHRILPAVVTNGGGTLVMLVTAYRLTGLLAQVFDNNGYLVFVTTVAVNCVLAVLLFGRRRTP